MRTTTEQSYRKALLRVLIHLQRYLDDPVDHAELSEIAGFSPFHFHRIFSGMMGESVSDHIRRIRLERAAGRLVLSDESVTQLAFEAGYESLEAFIRIFREMFGCSPTQFRKRRRRALYPSHPTGIHYRPSGELKNIRSIESGGNIMEVNIVDLEPMEVLFVRHTGPYHTVGASWEKLCGWAGPLGLLGRNTKFIGLAYDDPMITPPEKIRCDVCITLDHKVNPVGEFGVQTIPAGKYAMALHRGPYENFNDTYKSICGEWIPKNGKRIKSLPSIEIYLNHPDQTKPEDLLTEVYIPIE